VIFAAGSGFAFVLALSILVQLLGSPEQGRQGPFAHARSLTACHY
jgi:hypothetical protein